MRKHVLAAAMLTMVAPPAMAQIPATATAPAAEIAIFEAAEAKKAVAKLADELEKTFVFPDVAKRYAAALRTKLAAGGYDRFTDSSALAQAVTADLQAVAPDGHLRMFPAGGPPPRPQAVQGSQPSTPAPAVMEKAGMIAPGIAFVRFNAFFGEPDTLKAFTEFLNRNAGAKTLIIDIRTHRGGGLDEMDILFPRIFTKAQPLMVMDTRASVNDEGRPRSLVTVDAPAELSRSEHRFTPANPQTPWAGAKIYLLTSGRSASAAEHFASVLKNTRRGTLIGEVTAGAGNYGSQVQLGGGYSAFIPFGRSYFPGGDGWEGTGVAPDIKVAPERALVEALTREGISPAQAEALSVKYMPTGTMERRTPRKP